MEFTKQIEVLEKLGVTYYGVNMTLEKDEAGNLKRDKNERLIKQVTGLTKYKNIKLISYRTKQNNANIIPLGDCYNLIGVDVDNKEGTINKFRDLLEDNEIEFNTLTTTTINDGYHYYFRLNDEQRNKLKEFKAETGKLFNLHIDVKYNNQIFYDVCTVDNYKYEIINSLQIEILPDFIFNEIIRVWNEDGHKPKTEKKKAEKAEKEPKKEQIKTVNKEMNDRLRLYLDCLDEFYFSNYDEWFRIGAIIFNESGNFNLFNEYSKKGNNYDGQSIKKYWNDYQENRDKKVTIKKLIEIAEKANKSKYDQAYSKDTTAILEKIFKIIDDVEPAYLFYSLNVNNYIYDKTNKSWYKFNIETGIWKDYEEYKLMEDLYKCIVKTIDTEHNRKLSEMTDETSHSEREIITKQYIKIINFIGKKKNRENILSTLKARYEKEKLFELLDNIDPYLIGFNNGVYDLKTFTFRKGKPEEYITCSVGYDYKEPNGEIIEKLNKILIDVKPNEDERTYLLKSLSLGLLGKNLLEEFYIWIGNGSNGKGLLRDLLSQTLGNNYFDSMEIEYLDKARQGHANTPDSTMARKKDARLIITTEPEGETHLRTAKLKQISGNDIVQCRHLFKDLFNFVPKFKLIIQTNEAPIVEGYDGGTKRRLRLIYFRVKFVDNPKGTNQRKINRQLKEEIKKDEYKLAFFHILLKYYKLFVDNDNNKLEMPKTIEADTNEYLEENDPVSTFIKEQLIITGSAEDKIKSSDLYNLYKATTESNINMNIKKFKSIITNNGIEFKKDRTANYYLGIKEKINEEEPTTAISEVIAESPTEPEITPEVFEEVQKKKLKQPTIKNKKLILNFQ